MQAFCRIDHPIAASCWQAACTGRDDRRRSNFRTLGLNLNRRPHQIGRPASSMPTPGTIRPHIDGVSPRSNSRRSRTGLSISMFFAVADNPGTRHRAFGIERLADLEECWAARTTMCDREGYGRDLLPSLQFGGMAGYAARLRVRISNRSSRDDGSVMKRYSVGDANIRFDLERIGFVEVRVRA